MSGTAAERRTQARAIQNRDRAQAVEQEPALPAPQPPASPDAKRRQTVDLTESDHIKFARWRMETAVALGRTRLTTQDTLAALVQVLLDDETVARRVRARIADQQSGTPGTT